MKIVRTEMKARQCYMHDYKDNMEKHQEFEILESLSGSLTVIAAAKIIL